MNIVFNASLTATDGWLGLPHKCISIIIASSYAQFVATFFASVFFGFVITLLRANGETVCNVDSWLELQCNETKRSIP